MKLPRFKIPVAWHAIIDVAVITAAVVGLGANLSMTFFPLAMGSGDFERNRRMFVIVILCSLLIGLTLGWLIAYRRNWTTTRRSGRAAKVPNAQRESPPRP